MSEHPRPHLETHGRSKEQSATRGAAYRLGIRIFDEQTKTTFDFSRRAGVEVVFSETIAPQGAPAWAFDPAQLWNRVEAAEKRSNAQIARDYRIPVPLGVPLTGAVEMALAMASHIMQQLHVPVSVGVHRDSDTDLHGLKKDPSKVGFHAHLYFPTRDLVIDVAGGAGGEGGRGYFGKKLRFLANKNSSGHFVERINRRWAELANECAAKNGKIADYDHRSYERLGIDKRPTPKVPQAWIPRKRRPRPVSVPASVPVPASMPSSVPHVQLAAVRVLQRVHQQRIDRKTGKHVETRRTSRESARQNRVPSTKGAELSRAKVVAGRTVVLDKHLGLAELMRGAGPMPKDDAARAALERHMLLADFIESLLFAVERGRQEHGDFVMRLQREQIALADARHRRAMMEQELRDADEALERWLRKHPLRARFKLASREHGVLNDHRTKISELASTVNKTVQSHKKAERQLSLDRASRQAVDAEARRRILNAIALYKPDFRDVLAGIAAHLTAEQQALVEQVGDELGIPVQGIDDVLDAARSERAFDDAGVAPRPSPNPSVARH